VYATVSNLRDGKAAKRAGESENLPGLIGVTFVDGGLPPDLRIKKGNPGSNHFGPGFSFSDPDPDILSDLERRVR
jgi:hypothetical protein